MTGDRERDIKGRKEKDRKGERETGKGGRKGEAGDRERDRRR